MLRLLGVCIMQFKPVSAATAGIVLLTTVSQAMAGGKPVECYERYRGQPVYDTVYENLLVQPASRRVEIVPAIYGTRKREILISPERVSYEITPAVVHSRYRTVKVRDGGYSWEWRIIGGRKILCKIKHKARYERMAETVILRPEGRQRVIIPAEYSYVTEQVVIQPEQQRVIDIPPSYETVARQVLVGEGSSGWKRVHIPRHCKR